MTSKKHKPIPTFENEADEAEFWGTHDSAEYIDWTQAIRVKPQTKLISIRLPEPLLEEIRGIASSKSLPYQTLIRTWLVEKAKEST